MMTCPAAAASDAGPHPLQVVQVYSGLSFPVSFAFAADGRVFVTEKAGSIMVIGTNGTPQLWARLDALTAGEQGVLGLALHPNFAANGWVYAYYTDATNGTNRVVRLHDSSGAGTNLAVIVERIPNNGNHNGGVLAFMADGTLLVSTGDAGDPANAQNLGTRAGKVLRVNGDGSVPADNPFYGSLSADNLVFTYGHRNVFGLAVDPLNGRAWETENGPTCNDEVNLLAAGANYGWGPSATCSPGTTEGTNRDGPSPTMPAYVFPSSLPAVTQASFHAGALYFGAWNTGTVYRATLTAGRLGIQEVAAVHTFNGWGVLDVETGLDGRLYVSAANHDGSGGAIFAFTSLPPVAPVGEDHFLAYVFGGALVATLVLVYLWKRRRMDRRENS